MLKGIDSVLNYHWVKNDPERKAILTRLKKAQNSSELKDILLSEKSEKAGRVVDVLIFIGRSKPAPTRHELRRYRQLLEEIVNNLSPEDWYEILTSKNKSGQNLIGAWLYREGDPTPWELNFFTSNLSNKAKMALLTLPLKDKNYPDEEVSMATWIDISMLIPILNTLTDEEKMQVFLNFMPHSDVSLLTEADRRGEMSEILNTINDADIRKKISHYLETYKLRKKATHFLGIQDAKDPKIVYESMLFKDAIKYFKEELSTYIPSKQFKKEYDLIEEAFRFSNFGSDDQAESEVLHNRYLNKKLIFINAAWPKHFVAIAAIGNYLVVANRGEGMSSEGGCVIYHLKKPLSKKDIDFFVERNASKRKVQDRIAAIVKKDSSGKPVVFHAFPEVKSQKYGTCGIANKKAAVAGLLPLLKYLNTSRAKRGNTLEEPLLTEAREEYKKFTSSLRESVLDELLMEVNHHTMNAHELVEALSHFCNQHTDLEKKSELHLLSQLVNKLPSTLWNDFEEKLKPHAKLIVMYIKKNGIEEPLPDFLMHLKKEIKKNKYFDRELGQNSVEDYVQSVMTYLDGVRSAEEFKNWYGKIQAHKRGYYDILLSQLENMSSTELYNILSESTPFVQPKKKYKEKYEQFVFKLFDFLEDDQKIALIKQNSRSFFERASEPLIESILQICSQKDISSMMREYSKENNADQKMMDYLSAYLKGETAHLKKEKASPAKEAQVSTRPAPIGFSFVANKQRAPTISEKKVSKHAPSKPKRKQPAKKKRTQRRK